MSLFSIQIALILILWKRFAKEKKSKKKKKSFLTFPFLKCFYAVVCRKVVCDKMEGNPRDQRNSIEDLQEQLEAADDLIRLLLDPTTTPTTRAFLSAVYHRKSQAKILALQQQAQQRQRVPNIITGGHTKFRGDAPDAHNKLIELTGLLQCIHITDNMATIQYSELVVDPTERVVLSAAGMHAQDSRRRSDVHEAGDEEDTE